MDICVHMFSVLLGVQFSRNGIAVLYSVILCLTFWETFKLFSKVATPFYFPTSNIWGFQFVLFRFHLFIFRERGREGERKEEKHWCKQKHQLVASHICPNKGQNPHLPLKPGKCPDRELNQRSLTLQDNAQPTQTHQSELSFFFLSFNSLPRCVTYYLTVVFMCISLMTIDIGIFSRAF